jgi:hypothetical protein
MTQTDNNVSEQSLSVCLFVCLSVILYLYLPASLHTPLWALFTWYLVSDALHWRLAGFKGLSSRLFVLPGSGPGPGSATSEMRC